MMHLFYKYNVCEHIEGQNPKITRVTAIQYYPFFQSSSQPNTTLFGVNTEKHYTLLQSLYQPINFQNLHQTILILSQCYYQTIVNFFQN